jgi:beta-lactamase class D
VIADYKNIFDEYKVFGCFILFDPNDNKELIYNPAMCDSGFLPASTFKIPHALIALETGAIPGKDFTIKWDGVKRSVESWNKDHTLESAIQNSVVWYFEKTAELIGKPVLKQWLEKIGYGNTDVSGRDPFWLRGNLRISPREQLEFIKKFYNHELPFSSQDIQIVKDALLLYKNEENLLCGKTGWTVVDNYDIGWLIGYLEVKGKVIFFVNCVNSPTGNNKFAESRMAISKTILSDYTGISFSEN